LNTGIYYLMYLINFLFTYFLGHGDKTTSYSSSFLGKKCLALESYCRLHSGLSNSILLPSPIKDVRLQYLNSQPPHLRKKKSILIAQILLFYFIFLNLFPFYNYLICLWIMKFHSFFVPLTNFTIL